MEYEPVIGVMIDALMKAPRKYNFCYWHFDAFFHADTCPPGAEPSPMYNTNDKKMEMLREFFYCPFIWTHTIPPGHTLTADDLRKMKEIFAVPETVEEFKEMFRNPRKPHFPHYETDHTKLKAYIKECQKV